MQSPVDTDPASPSFLAGGGEMGMRIRAFDWTRTGLGPPVDWPAPLRTALRILLTTNHPVFIFWGPELVCFYNDAYSRSLGPEKHPCILGARGREAWDEIWPLIGPQIEHVKAGLGATWHEDHLVPITRHGRLEQVYWTYSYGPIDDESAPNGVGGVLVLCTETTAQVQARQQLRAAESRWRSLFDQTPGFVCVLSGPSHRFEYANEQYLQLLGGRQVVGRFLAEAIPEAEEQRFVALLDEVYRTGKVYVANAAPFSLRRTDDGPAELLYLDFVYQPLRDAEGNVWGIFVEGYDVSDRKRMETALVESERRLRIGLESAQGGIYDWNIETGELHWSDGHFRLFGIEPGTVKPTFELWRRHVHPDDVDRILSAIEHAIATGQRYSADYRVCRADGTVRWLHGQGLLLAEEGRERRLIGAVIDIHERRQAEAALRKSEERFRRLANDVPSLVWMSDARGEIEFLNRQCCEFFDVTPEQLRAGGWHHLIHPDDLERFRAEYEASIREQRTFHVRVRMRHASGEWRHMEPTGSPRTAEDGAYLGHVGMCPDVTDVVLSQDVLREADRRKDEFLATLSHELRNPLAPIRSAARLLRATDSDLAARTWASEVIDRQIGTMAALLDDLLDISRITRGTMTISRRRVTLSSIVEAALEVARPLVEARHHRFVASLPETPIPLDADPLRLSQALSNLITNAAKYTDPGGDITLTAQVLGGEVAVVVADTGIGLAPDSMTRIFTMFSQVESALDRSQGGLGIGLALVKGIVELHGGRVEARSDGVGRGSEFRVTLPMGVDAVASAQPAHGPASTTSRAPRRILVADDNRDGADSLAILLGLSGHQVSVAHGGHEALARTRELKPDVVVLDIGMPDLNGYDVASRLRQDPSTAGVVLIALTGWGGEVDKGKALAAGFDHHLTKPVDPDMLEALL